jgi:hypothetical protein
MARQRMPRAASSTGRPLFFGLLSFQGHEAIDFLRDPVVSGAGLSSCEELRDVRVALLVTPSGSPFALGLNGRGQGDGDLRLAVAARPGLLPTGQVRGRASQHHKVSRRRTRYAANAEESRPYSCFKRPSRIPLDRSALHQWPPQRGLCASASSTPSSIFSTIQ